MTDPLGRVTSYEYDDLGRLISTTLPDPDGTGPLTSPVSTTEYDPLGNVISQTDALNNITSYTYDELSRAVTITDAMSGTTSFTYNDAGQTTSTTDALGRLINYGYDDLGWLITTTLPDPDDTGPLGRPVYTTNYDKAGNVTNEIDPLNNLTGYEYDNLNRRTKTIATDPDGGGPLATPIYATTYDKLGNVLTETDPLLRVTSFQYDNLGRLITTTLPDPDGAGPLTSPIYQAVYDAAGNVTSEIDPLGNTTLHEYDNLNRLVETTEADPDGGGPLTSPVTTYAYDAASQLTSVTDPLGRVTQHQYDDLGRQIKLIEPDPDGAGPLVSPEHLTAYDAVGNVISQTDPLGNVTEYGYDELYRRTSITDALLGVTSFDFDAVGNLLGLTDPESNTTTWEYDGLNRVITETNALLAVRAFSYDAVGNLLERTDRNGRVTEYVYDNHHRRIEEKWLDGQTVVRTISSTYDSASQLSDVTDPSSTYAYVYDPLGRATEIEHQLAGLSSTIVMAQGFDALSRRTSLNSQIGASLDFANGYQYDGLSRLTRITQQGQTGGNAVAEKRVDLAYNASSQFTGITRYNDLAGAQTVVATNYGYDALGRLTDLTHSQGATTLADYGWTYDAFSRVTQFTSLADGTSDYGYDDRNQLTTADHSSQTDENYSYDANGNRTGTGAKMLVVYGDLARAIRRESVQAVAYWWGITPWTPLAGKWGGLRTIPICGLFKSAPGRCSAGYTRSARQSSDPTGLLCLAALPRRDIMWIMSSVKRLICSGLCWLPMVVMAGILFVANGAVTTEADDAAKPPGHLIPESLDNWTITYSSVVYTERIGEFSATFTSRGHLRLRNTFRGKRETPDFEATLTDDETRTIYQATRDIMNWFRLKDPKVPTQTDSHSEESLTLSLDDGRFVFIRVQPDLSPLNVEAQDRAIGAIIRKYRARAEGPRRVEAEDSPQPAPRMPQSFAGGVVPKSLKAWSFAIANRHWWVGMEKPVEGTPSIATISSDGKIYYDAPSGKGAESSFPHAERDRLYALARKIFNGYQLEATADSTRAPRIVLSFAAAGVQSLRFNVDQETLRRLGALEEYARVARIARQRLAEKRVDARFVLPWESPTNKSRPQ